MKTKRILVVAVALAAGVPAAAGAHISVPSGPAFAGATQEITLGVGHGCEGADTVQIRVDVPSKLGSVRPVVSAFGRVTLEKDESGAVTAVTWKKDDKDVLDSDTHYYALTLRAKMPSEPFTRLLLPTHQTCRAADGTTTTTDWVGASEPAPNSGQPEPAPAVVILPPRAPGWNKYVVPADIAEMKMFFADASIVWKGNSAFSVNPTTTELIGGTSGVTPLTSLKAGDEIWVKY